MAGRVREGVATRQRIVTTAERLFGRHGINGVSLREIAATAKVNSAAVNYHFGTKRDLVAAILELRAAAALVRTEQILDAIDWAEPSLRQIAEALVRPTAESGRHYAAFLVAISDDPSCARLANRVFEEPSKALLELYLKAEPALPPEVATYRFAVAQVLAIQALGKRRARIDHWIRQLHDDAHVDDVDALIDLIAGGLGAPIGPQPPEASKRS